MALRTAVSSPIPNDQNHKSSHDQNQEANSALMELEKGLRSNKIGEQCEAIVNVPSLLQRYPYPILVNSAFLKLSDVFRTGSNFLKLCVLKAIQSSKKHLEKIFNVDEFCRRFFAVIHSNDPVARAITLRVFGNISSIIAEKKNIHHCIRNSLDSHDTVEVEAAIFATKCFAEQSSTFASGVWSKIADMIKGLTTPVEMKLKLLQVLKFMYHEFATANQVMKLFRELLLSYPTHEFVCTILNTSTLLTIATLVNTTEQVDLLLEYLKDDPRKSVNLIAIKNLSIIAKRAPHLWNGNQVSSLLTCVTASYHDVVKKKILLVSVSLTNCLNAEELFQNEALDLLEELTSDMNIEVSSLALESRALVLSKKPDTQQDADALSAIESDVEMLLALSLSEKSKPALMRCLHSAEVFLSKLSQGKSDLVPFVVECMETLEGDYLYEALHTLVSVSTYQHNLCQLHVETLLSLFERSLQKVGSKRDKDILVGLLTLILQSSSNLSSTYKINMQQKLSGAVSMLIADGEFWTVFKMARQASRQIYPIFAAKAFSALIAKVSSEHLYFWLKALSNFQEGEAVLLESVESVAELQDKLMKAQDCYQQGLTNVKAAVTTDHPLYFQFKFARLRSDTLLAFSQLLVCCASIKLNPPPAIARSLALATGQEVHILSRLGIQFHNCALMFSNVALGYQNLYKASFNSDPTSLQNIQILQESSQNLAYAIETLVTRRSGERVSPECSSLADVKPLNRYLQKLSDTNLSILDTIKRIDEESKESPFSHTQIECLKTFILYQLSVSYSYPLYFFKSLQNTVLQLSISPCNTQRDEAHLVNLSHDMSLKIEGVVKELSKSAIFRHVAKVNISVKVKPTENVRNPVNEIKPVQSTEVILKESTIPLHDYFSSEFLLSFKYIGQHIVRISCGVTDEHGVDWDTGPSYMTYVEVYEQIHGHVKRR